MPKYDRAVPDHKKHSVFPGLRITPEVQVVGTTIKPKINRRPENIPQGKPVTLSPEWDEYEAALVRIRDSNANHATGVLLPIRNGFEQKYELASRKLRKEGKLYMIKRKYR